MKICLLSYRGNPYCGGQGVYVYYLSRELRNLGHEVHLLSGPPYPEIADGVTIHKLESLSFFDSQFSRWRVLSRVRNPLRLYEYLTGCFGMFAEPFTFSVRAYGRLRQLLSRHKLDIVHDNQCLGYGLLLMERLKVPVIATIHHPIPIDKEIDLAQATSCWDKFRLMRWYSFISMQRLVSTRLDRVITVSHSSAEDIARTFKIPDSRTRVVHNGVDIDFYRGDGSVPNERNSLIMVGGATGHIKGLSHLLRALHLLRGEVDVRLTVVGTGPDAQKARLIKEYGLEDVVTFTGTIEREELRRRYSSAEIAVVPSLYEGFSFPAAEAMSCRLPVVATRAGALPEVVGEDGEAGILVPPADSEALAAAIKRLLGDESLRKRMGESGRKRVERNFTWSQAARKTVQVYEELL